MSGRLVAVIVAGVVVVAGIVFGAAALIGGGDHDRMASGHGSNAGMADTPDRMMTGPALDGQMFLEQMAPHHESAIAMATIALQKGKRPEIRTLAEGIIGAQKSEIAQMTAWHREWFGDELVPSMSGPHANVDTDDLESATGDEFDRAFIDMMIPHHQSAIAMAKSVKESSPPMEISTLADEIIAAQATEIAQMKSWRAQWFPPAA